MKYNILCLIANHTCNNIKYNISLNNISLIKKYLKNIVIIDSKDESNAENLYTELKDENIIKNYFFTENNCYYDFGKWIYALENINYSDYDYILFLNDSIILTENIDNYFHYIENVMDDVNIYGYNDSTQIQYHYQSYCFLLNISIIDKFINFFNSKKHLIFDLNSLVNNIELYLHTIDDNRDCFLKIGNNYNMSKNLYWENEVLYQYLLSKNIFGIMKLKKIYDMQHEFKITIYGHNIENFDYDFYKTYYDDLNNLSDTELLNHFIEHGQYEGRRFNSSCNTFLLNYYREKLDSIKLLYFFDIPCDFDIYYYKKNYDDIKHLSIIDTMFHYINHGYYEGRIYNKIDNKNYYLNSFYITILNKLNHNYKYDNDDLNNLNIYFYIIFNDDLNKASYMNALKHYLEKGKKQKIYTKKDLDDILSNIDLNIYKSIYPELCNSNSLEIIQHYVKNNNDNLNNPNLIYKLPNDFDIHIYKNIYNDISKLSDNELTLHYMLYGKKEGRIYKIPDDFNCDIYQKIYKDLKGKSNDELIKHYLYDGLKENRIYKIPDDFDCDIYRNIYNDLSDLNDKELMEHYIKFGINDKRIYKIPNDFDYITYKTIYNDLKDLSNEELTMHYLIHGYNEKRIYKIPDDFDCITYKNIYKDLKNLTDEELKLHFLYNGYNEKRIYKIPDDFDCNFYKNIYTELLHSNDDKIKEHYLLNYLNNKEYKLPEDFDYNIYKNIYDDLQSLDENQLKKHYFLYGINENRSYKINIMFNHDNYRKIYKDVLELSDSDLEKHYLTIGIKEKRIYKIPDDFDYITYKTIYSDLSNLSDSELENHYLFYGIHEKRIYKLHDDFNIITYKKLNKDLSKLNNEQLVNHYLVYGIHENRKYK